MRSCARRATPSATSPCTPARDGKALLKGNKILSPFSDDAELVLRVVAELVPNDAELGHKLLRPAELRSQALVQPLVTSDLKRR